MAKKNKKKEVKEEIKEQSPIEESEPKAELSVEEIREERKRKAEEKKAAKQDSASQRDEFRKFFAKKRNQLKLDSSLEHIIWLHFVSAGFAQKDKFEEGLKHFGIHN